jgi:hypothetical protein
METKIIFFEKTNCDANSNAVEIERCNFAGITFIPRVGENVYIVETGKHYIVTEIQHVFDKQSDIETKHTININLK